MIASQIWKVAPLRIKVIFWISVLKLKEDKQTYFRCFPEQEKHIQKDTIRHHHFIDRAKRQNSLHDSITVFGNEESNKMQSIKCNFWTFISLFLGGGGGSLPVFNRLFHAGFSRVDKDQLAKSVYTAGKSATELVNLLSLKVIQLKGAEK